MTVVVHENAFRPHVVVTGDLDACGVVSLRRALAPMLDGRSTVVSLDLGGVDFADCAGVRGWHRLVRDGHAAGTRLEVVTPSAAVRRLVGLLESAA